MTDAEKQIEEIAKVIERSGVYIDSNDINSDDGEYYGQWELGCIDLANVLYSADCRKIAKAKWIPVSTKPGVYAGMKCSLCKAKISYRDFYSGNHNYCHKCGAKMIKED